MHSIPFAHHVVELVELYLFRESVPLRVLLSSRRLGAAGVVSVDRPSSTHDVPS